MTPGVGIEMKCVVISVPAVTKLVIEGAPPALPKAASKAEQHKIQLKQAVLSWRAGFGCAR
eukprot:2983305-Amphidinium_carterae.1